MGIAAPISAVLTAALPVLFSAFTAGVPAPLQLAGFALAGLAIGLISWPQRTTEPPTGIGLAGLSGCGFGCFFILISRVHPATTYWSLAAARCTSIAVLLPVMRLRRKPLLPPMTGAPLVVLAGILDALGNVLFVFAAHSGRRAARARDTRTDHRCAARAPGHPCDLGLSHFLFYPLDTVSMQSVLMDALCLKSPKSHVFSVGQRA
jgi:hypothetical protein